MKKIIASIILLGPIFVSAQVAGECDPRIDSCTQLEGLIRRFVDAIVDPLVALAFAAAFLLFMYGLLTFMLSISNSNTDAAGPMKTADGKRHMLWGLIGMVIMFSVGGILNVISNSVGQPSDPGDRTNPIQLQGGFQ